MTNYFRKFRNIGNTFLFFTGIPSLVSFFAEKLGYNALQVFFVTLLMVWIASIEFRLKDIKYDRERK